jgi:hypothetical protein
MWIKSQWKVAPSVSSILARMFTVLCMALIFGVATKACAGQTTIAVKRSHDFYISLTSNAGKLVAGKNEYCALFSRTRGGELTPVEDVVIEFAQQVGRITERPTKFHLSVDNLGRYCGEVGLGKQYYQPAYYHVTVHYADSSRKKIICRFFLTVK